MTSANVAEGAAGTIDFIMMYATHDAFRSDLDRLAAAGAAGKAGIPQVRAGWQNFKTQLLIHHSVEDSHLWPALQRAVARRPGDLALLDQMQAEHAQIDPLLAAVDKALTGSDGDYARPVRDLSAALIQHLTHEEQAALPLIQSVLTPSDWRAFAGQMRRRQGVKGAAVYVPWVLDGTARPRQREFLAQLPGPVRLICRLLWQPRYRRRNLWKL
jgi:iron-sulfur cluster repair protein YtfE (RIC family)